MESLDDTPQSSKSDTVKRNLKLSFHESTPVLKTKSRKRKSFICNSNHQQRKFSEIIQLNERSYHSSPADSSSYDFCVNDSCASNDCKRSSSQSRSFISNYDFSFDIDHVMVSSPLDKNNETVKLTSSLEKCSLLDFDISSKRIKWDYETPNGKRKSNSAPGTPQRSGADSDDGFKKYHSLDFTPKKSYSNKKFGFESPECKKILYPQLIERKPAIKPKSPEKLRAELKRLNKPAKKRLFSCHDFVYYFTRKYNLRQIVHQTFSYLNDYDLANVVKVSKLWKHTVQEDSEIYSRYKEYHTYMVRSKENLRCSFTDSDCSKFNEKQRLSIEKENYQTAEVKICSPVKTKWQKYTRLAEKLAPEQLLIKCPMCNDPSVLERNIAQCTKHGCQYIWCNRCSSGSKQGPDYFICKCEKGTTPPRTEKSSLGDISNRETPKNCSFLNDHYYNCSSNMNNTGNTSSGYFSQSDIEKSAKVSTKIVKSALGPANRCPANERRIVESESNLNSFHSVVEMCMKKKLHKVPNYEPSSPPKVKLAIVGSEKSKKSLRRLCR